MAAKKPAKKVMGRKALRKTRGGAALSGNPNSMTAAGDRLPMEQVSINYSKLER